MTTTQKPDQAQKQTQSEAKSRPEFIYVTYIATTREKLWQALTDGEFTQKYWGDRAVASDWQVGSPVLFRRTAHQNEPDVVRARVLEIDPPKYLAMSWAYELTPGVPETPASKVTYTLQNAGPENVKLTVVHEVWEPGSTVDQGLMDGWSAILSSLKTWLETGDSLEITKRWVREGR
ncbi:MAG TPA: SRPBCC family protein [Candidatus Obscuribacterales bacterium]